MPLFPEAILFSCSCSQRFGLLLFTGGLHRLPAFWSLWSPWLAGVSIPFLSGRSLSLLPSTQTAVAPPPWAAPKLAVEKHPVSLRHACLGLSDHKPTASAGLTAEQFRDITRRRVAKQKQDAKKSHTVFKVSWFTWGARTHPRVPNSQAEAASVSCICSPDFPTSCCSSCQMAEPWPWAFLAYPQGDNLSLPHFHSLKHSTFYSCLSGVSLFTVSVTRDPTQFKNITWKLPELMNLYLFHDCSHSLLPQLLKFGISSY